MFENDLNVIRESYKFKHQDLVNSMRGYTEVVAPVVKNVFIEIPEQVKRFFAILNGDVNVFQPARLDCSAAEC